MMFLRDSWRLAVLVYLNLQIRIGDSTSSKENTNSEHQNTLEDASQIGNLTEYLISSIYNGSSSDEDGSQMDSEIISNSILMIYFIELLKEMQNLYGKLLLVWIH